MSKQLIGNHGLQSFSLSSDGSLNRNVPMSPLFCSGLGSSTKYLNTGIFQNHEYIYK